MAPAAALIAAAAAGEPLLAHWTQTFMGGGAQFLAQFFPLFLLGALFGKLMEDSGSVEVIARFMTEKLGTGRAVLAVVLAGAIVTYGGVSLFVAIFVIVPMAQGLFRTADIPLRLMPAAIALGTMTFTMSALPGTPPCKMPFRCHSSAQRPSLLRASASSRLPSCLPSVCGGSDGWRTQPDARVRATVRTSVAKRQSTTQLCASEPRSPANSIPPRFRTAVSPAAPPGALMALLPLIVVIAVNLAMSIFVLPRLDTSFLAEERWGSDVSFRGWWRVGRGRGVACGNRHFGRAQLLTPAVAQGKHGCRRQRLGAARPQRLQPCWIWGRDSGSSRFCLVRDWVLSIQGGPLVSLAVATNVLAALTGSASGGLTIALDALGETYLRLAAEQGIDPALLHRVAVMSAGTLDSLPHNGAVVTLLAVCGVSHRQSYFNIFMVAIVGALIALAVVILLGSAFGSF